MKDPSFNNVNYINIPPIFKFVQWVPITLRINNTLPWASGTPWFGPCLSLWLNLLYFSLDPPWSSTLSSFLSGTQKTHSCSSSRKLLPLGCSFPSSSNGISLGMTPSYPIKHLFSLASSHSLFISVFYFHELNLILWFVYFQSPSTGLRAPWEQDTCMSVHHSFCSNRISF